MGESSWCRQTRGSSGQARPWDDGKREVKLLQQRPARGHKFLHRAGEGINLSFGRRRHRRDGTAGRVYWPAGIRSRCIRFCSLVPCRRRRGESPGRLISPRAKWLPTDEPAPVAFSAASWRRRMLIDRLAQAFALVVEPVDRVGVQHLLKAGQACRHRQHVVVEGAGVRPGVGAVGVETRHEVEAPAESAEADAAAKILPSVVMSGVTPTIA